MPSTTSGTPTSSTPTLRDTDMVRASPWGLPWSRVTAGSGSVWGLVTPRLYESGG